MNEHLEHINRIVEQRKPEFTTVAQLEREVDVPRKLVVSALESSQRYGIKQAGSSTVVFDSRRITS